MRGRVAKELRRRFPGTVTNPYGQEVNAYRRAKRLYTRRKR